MEPLNTFCLAAHVFLSLPLPLFASTSLAACPTARRSLMPWVWANAIGGGIMGLLIIAKPVHPLAALAVGSGIFIACGMQMFFRLARVAGARSAPKTARRG